MERKQKGITHNANTWKDLWLSGTRDGILLVGSFYVWIDSGHPLGLSAVPLFVTGYMIGKKLGEIERKMQTVEDVENDNK